MGESLPPLDLALMKTRLIEDAELLDDITKSQFDIQSGHFYQFIINFLTNLDMDAEEAKRNYYRILEHRFSLSQRMGRDVGIRVATLDYFLHVHPMIHNPRFVEISIFEELLRMSKEDQKTGCFNATFLHDFTEREIKRASRNGTNVSILLMDIDNFKYINDHFGHMVGDTVIKRFAECLLSCARTEDVAARFGGDEFALLMPQTGRIGSRSLAERFRNKLQQAMKGLEADGNKVPVTFSGGIATYPLDASGYEELIREADRALYKAKHAGRNHIFDQLEQAYMADLEASVERRIAKRYSVSSSAPVSLDGLFGNDRRIATSARIVNLSRGGLLLECNAQLALESREDLVSITPMGDLPPILGARIEATVVRDQSEMNFLKFYLGVKLNKPLGSDSLLELERRGIIGREIPAESAYAPTA